MVCPSPRVFHCMATHSFDICKWLLSHDVELYLGPKSDKAQELAEMPQLPHEVNASSVRLQKGQEGFIKTFTKAKQNHAEISFRRVT